jgi:uncharacterized protein YdaU (DUF1376 family)
MEDLAYRRLLDHYYLHEAPIKQRDIARQIGMRDYEQEVLTVLDEFFLSTENGYINPRADDEIEKYRKLSEDGKRGAAKRWSKGGNSPPNATPIATINQEPLTNNQEPYLEVAKATRPRQAGTPPAPVEQIVEMYNTMLPMLSAVTVVNDSRRRAISSRWREVVTADKLDREKGLEFFQWFFDMVSKSKFLTGKVKDWKADIDFLFNASKFPRIVEGTYHKE